MICAKALAVGPRKSFSMCVGQGDFENGCTVGGLFYSQEIVNGLLLLKQFALMAIRYHHV